MKAPKYVILSTQQAIDAGLNAFALILMAESFADDPDKFGDENILLLARGHNGQEVWFVMTKTQPRELDFEPVAVVPPVADHGPYCERRIIVVRVDSGGMYEVLEVR